MPALNPDLVAIYNALCSQQDALSAQIQQTTDPAMADTISTEIQEIAHRILLAQNLLFKADDPRLTTLAASVASSSQKLTTAIGQITQVTNFLNSVSSFLAVVDQAIDLAKTLAAAAAA
jgi:hypothetical protein